MVQNVCMYEIDLFLEIFVCQFHQHIPQGLSLPCGWRVHDAIVYKHRKNKLVVLTTEWLPWLQINWRDSGYERFTLVWKTNCIRQPKM